MEEKNAEKQDKEDDDITVTNIFSTKRPKDAMSGAADVRSLYVECSAEPHLIFVPLLFFAIGIRKYHEGCVRRCGFSRGCTHEGGIRWSLHWRCIR